MNLQASITLAIAASVDSAADLTTNRSSLNYNPHVVLSDGVGANQAQVIFSDTRALALGANETLDLNGVLLDAFGAVVNFTKVKAIAIKAANTNVGDLQIGGAAAQAFVGMFADPTDKLLLKSGGFICVVAPGAAGMAVGAGASDQLKITNADGANAASYDIVIIGS
jgi:hypothetical protein